MLADEPIISPDAEPELPKSAESAAVGRIGDHLSNANGARPIITKHTAIRASWPSDSNLPSSATDPCAETLMTTNTAASRTNNMGLDSTTPRNIITGRSAFFRQVGCTHMPNAIPLTTARTGSAAACIKKPKKTESTPITINPNPMMPATAPPTRVSSLRAPREVDTLLITSSVVVPIAPTNATEISWARLMTNWAIEGAKSISMIPAGKYPKKSLASSSPGRLPSADL